jgi:hypothetical protein
MKHLNFLLLFALMASTVQAQTGISGFSKPEGDVSISFSMTNENYDEVFLVPSEIQGVPVFNEVTTMSYNLYAEFGISDRFTLSVNMPYIISEGEATQATLDENGFSNQRDGFQDLSLNFKYLIKSFELGSSKLNLLANLGYETPMSKYDVDEGLQSIIAIGNRSNRINGIGLAHFKMNNGLFATGQLGYSVRSNDVPDAILSQFKIGYAGSKFYGDVFIGAQKSQSGVDILGEGFQGFFPETRVSYTRIGLNLYAPIYKEFGISAGAAQVVDGRNIGKSTGAYGGLIYSF